MLLFHVYILHPPPSQALYNDHKYFIHNYTHPPIEKHKPDVSIKSNIERTSTKDIKSYLIWLMELASTKFLIFILCSPCTCVRPPRRHPHQPGPRPPTPRQQSLSSASPEPGGQRRTAYLKGLSLEFDWAFDDING
jgi:hypothetical protein